jgi:hypothetical protein
VAEIEATKLAIEMVASGVTPYRAAKECGIALNTIYRALARRKAKDDIAAKPATKPKPLATVNPEPLELREVPASLVSEWKLVRKAKRAGPITETVLKAMIREADKAGINLVDAVRICVERGWQGFRADYVRHTGRHNAVDSFLQKELGGGAIDITPKSNGAK